MPHDPQPSPEQELDRSSEPPDPEPTHSETRQRFSTAPPPEPARRVSARPSAFGPPRPSRPPSVKPSAPPAQLGPDSTPPTDPGCSRLAPLPDLPTLDPTPGFRADVAELLPLPDASQSLPRIPIAAVLPPPEARAPQGRGLPRVAAFLLVVAASAMPVLRYTGVLEEPETPHVVVAPKPTPSPQLAPATQTPVPRAVPPAAPAPARVDPVAEALARIEPNLPADGHEAAEMLVEAAERATAERDLDVAEALLGRALKLDDRNPHAAFGLAKVRLGQGNVEGAEGWVLVALEYRPKRAEYHAFYADVLERLDRDREARHERERARELSRR